jgi:glycosyltransferase involved in cell wall biosynthesis
LAKRVIISVISDLVTDQRVHKVCTTLHNEGYKILLIGAKRKKSKILEPRLYKTKRISLLFQKGFGMYAEWNIRLFFILLFKKTDIFLANDLDTLLPNFLVGKFKGKKIVYDSHEYFTEQEEVQNRKFVKKIWTKLEQFIFPKLKNVYTVNESIAKIYTEKYNVSVKVVRNMPMLTPQLLTVFDTLQPYLHEWKDKTILLTQGTGMNANRGIEELILSMKQLPGQFVLLIVGGGLVIEELKLLVVKENLAEKIHFTGQLIPDELKLLTSQCFCGFSLDKPTCLNYYYSLPNKLFDYIAANIPVIGSNMPEVANVIEKYKVGLVLSEVTPTAIAQQVGELYNNTELYNECKKNTITATGVLNWNTDAEILIQLFKQL